MYCKKCGAEIPDNSLKCPNCGEITGGAQFTAPFPEETGDLIIRAAAAVLGLWLIFTVYRNVTGTLSYIISLIGYLRYGINYLLEILFNIITLFPNLMYVGLGVFYIYTAAVWDRKKMDGLFGGNVILIFMIIFTVLLSFIFGMVHYGVYYASSFRYMFKMCLPSLMAFLAFYIIVSLICPVMPLADMKNKDSLKQNLNKVQDIIPETKNDDEKPEKDLKPVPDSKPIQNETYVSESELRAPAVMLTTNRGVFKFWILTFLTCGIYGDYQIYKIAKEMNICCAPDGKKTAGLLKFILLTLITCGFYPFYYWYSLENRIQANGRRYGLYIQEGGGTVLLWIILGGWLCFIGVFVAYNIIFKNMNALFMAYNSEHMPAVNEINQGGN